VWWPVFRAWVFVTGAVVSGGFLSRVFGGYFFQGFSEVFNVFAPEGGSVETVSAIF